MEKSNKRQLEAKGYRIEDANDFLELSPEESAYIEMKLALSQALAQKRKQRRLTQLELARKLNSSQSRVAKMEKGDPTVSVDLLLKALLAMGATKESIAKIIG
ncbi:MAG: XRE family transcriptional regulator [Deltaproteobacteria bacterium]|nr:XRE family transcriptional regulator [Deltaproteobacteria bacterium]